MPSRAQKKIYNRFKRIRARAWNLETTLNSLNSSLTGVEKKASVATRHEYNVDALVVVDADFTGTQCGPFVTKLYGKFPFHFNLLT